MKNIFPISIRLFACLIIMSFSTSASADFSAKQVLDKIYGRYDKNQDCWIVKHHDAQNQTKETYCMKIQQVDNIDSDTGKRVYILATGDAIDGAHVTPGLIGAFILQQVGDRIEMIANDPAIQMGSNGSAPSEWKLVKLAPSDYWGWQGMYSDCHFGYCGTRYVILAPYGKGIRDVSAGLVASFDDAGACGDEECENKTTSLESTIKLDASQINQKIFPLLITISGQQSGKKLKPKTWELPFDEKSWSYTQPDDWPFKDLAF